MPDINIDLGIAAIIRELREWWEKAKARGDAARIEASRSSAHRLAVGFVHMAGLLDTFADQLDHVLIRGSRTSMEPLQATEIGRELQHLVRSMQSTLTQIKADLDLVDLNWSVTNLGVLDDAYVLFHVRSTEVERIAPLVVTLQDGRAVLIHREQFGDLGRRLRKLAGDSRRVANEVTKTLQTGNDAAS